MFHCYVSTLATEIDRAHQKPMKTPGESNIRQHTVCGINRKEGINIQFKVIGPNKKTATYTAKSRNRSLQHDRNCVKLILQHTKIETHNYIETATLRLYKL